MDAKQETLTHPAESVTSKMIRTKTRGLTKIIAEVSLNETLDSGNRGRLVDNGEYTGHLLVKCEMLPGSRGSDLKTLVEQILEDLLGKRLSDFEESLSGTTMKGEYHVNFEFSWMCQDNSKIDLETQLSNDTYTVMGKIDTRISACVCTIS